MSARGCFMRCILVVLVARAAARDTCLFNSTHCACSHRPAAQAGLCLHHDSSAETTGQCKVENCTSDNYICNCDGQDLCKIRSCGAWKMLDETAEVPSAGTDGVGCKFVENNKCLKKVVEIAPEYKMVQIGDDKVSTNLFNMTLQVDKNDRMTTSFGQGTGDGMHGLWPDVESLKSRQLNFRLYRGHADPNSKFVCMIINTWAHTEDRRPNYEVHTTISAAAGETVKWLQCDDIEHKNRNVERKYECMPPFEGETLNAIHNGMGLYSDGWCAGPLLENGKGVSIRVSGIKNLEGINFLGSDGDKKEFLFSEKLPGFTGQVTDNGFVKDGAIPEIKINLAGISVE